MYEGTTFLLWEKVINISIVSPDPHLTAQCNEVLDVQK